MYLSNPAVVEMRFGEESKFKRFGVDTKFIKLAVETRLTRFGVDTTPEILLTYPRVPNPIVVEVN